MQPASPDAAYGAAHNDLLTILRQHQAPDPHALASELLNALVGAGWVWRPREVPPPRGRPAPREVAAARAAEARAALSALHHVEHDPEEDR